ELGGKSPNLVFPDANLDDAIPSSVWSIYYSAGQSCEARSRVLVEASLYDEFVSRFADYAKQIRVGDPLDPETQMGSLISTAHRDRVHGFVERGQAAGAEVVAGGEHGDGKGASSRSTRSTSTSRRRACLSRRAPSPSTRSASNEDASAHSRRLPCALHEPRPRPDPVRDRDRPHPRVQARALAVGRVEPGHRE